jgi:hypothetical protein
VRGEDQALEVALKRHVGPDRQVRPTYRGRTRRPPSLWPLSASSVGDEKPREHFNRACALLDLIGSGDPDQPTEAQVDPREHRRALIEALDVGLGVHRVFLNDRVRVRVRAIPGSVNAAQRRHDDDDLHRACQAGKGGVTVIRGPTSHLLTDEQEPALCTYGFLTVMICPPGGPHMQSLPSNVDA